MKKVPTTAIIICSTVIILSIIGLIAFNMHSKNEYNKKALEQDKALKDREAEIRIIEKQIDTDCKPNSSGIGVASFYGCDEAKEKLKKLLSE